MNFKIYINLFLHICKEINNDLMVIFYIQSLIYSRIIFTVFAYQIDNL
jgi:hypothetical protein